MLILDPMVAHFNKKATDTAAERRGKQCRKRKPWVSSEKLDLFDQRKDLKKTRGEPEGTKDCSDLKKNQDRDGDGKRDLNRGSMPGSRNLPQKELQQESIPASQGRQQ